MSDSDEDDAHSTRPETPQSLSDVAGLDSVKQQLDAAILTPLRASHLSTYGASGILIHGPPGSGKSYLAEALLADLGFERIEVTPADIPLADQDTAAEYVDDLRERVRDASPVVLYVEDLDIVAPAADSQDTPARSSQVVGELCRLLDALNDADDETFFVGVTCGLGGVHRRVRQQGRIDLTLGVPQPSPERRRAILQDEIDAAREQGIDFSESLTPSVVVDATEGMSAAEVVGVVDRAVRTAAIEEPTVYTSDLLEAVEAIADDDPTATGDAADDGDDDEIEFGEFVPGVDDETEESDAESDQEKGLGDLFEEGPDQEATDDADDTADSDDEAVKAETVPGVTYDDIGGLPEVKQRLREVTVWPRKYPDRFADLDIDTAKGIILHGPPGTGKTMLARAVATETDSTFFSISGPEVLDKYVGESERAVRELFDDAREAAPSVVFIDELDAVMGSRGGYTTDAPWLDTLVNQFLSELDGLDELADVVVVGATNRIEIIDPAIRRPGRLGEEIEVPPPKAAGRREIFRIHTADRNLAEDVDIEWLVAHTDDRYTGADIEELCERAAMNAMRDSVETNPDPDAADDWPIHHKHFVTALESVEPTMAGEGEDSPKTRDGFY